VPGTAIEEHVHLLDQIDFLLRRQIDFVPLRPRPVEAVQFFLQMFQFVGRPPKEQLLLRPVHAHLGQGLDCLQMLHEGRRRQPVKRYVRPPFQPDAQVSADVQGQGRRAG